MSWKAWKSAEKECASIINGLRRWRVSYSERIGDIIHPKLSVEVKYGKQIPKCLIVKEPTWRGGYYLIPSNRRNSISVIARTRQKNIFLENALRQAESYDSGKVAVVALKPVRYKGMIFACRSWNAPILERLLREGKSAGEKKGKKTPPPYDISYF